MDSTEGTRFVRCGELLEADVNGEIVALHVDRGQCYGMNEVATRIWGMLSTPATIGEICGKLVSEYEIDEDRCRDEVQRLVQELKSEGLVASLDS